MVNLVNGLRTMSTMAAEQIADCRRPPSAVPRLPDTPQSPILKSFSTSDPEQARENVQICHPWIKDYVPRGVGLARGDISLRLAERQIGRAHV